LTNGDDLSFTLPVNDNPGVVSADIAGDVLTLDFLDNQHGVANITVRATDLQGAYVDESFLVTVAAVNDAPVVVTPIADVTVDQDAADTVVDLAAVFDDADIPTDADSLTLTVVGNDNSGLVSPSLVGDTLTLSYVPGENGTANVTIRATDQGGLWVEDTLLVTVNATATDDRAIGETTVNGTVVSGDLTETEVADNVYEAIQEESYAKNKKSRLEHVWDFNVTGGATVTFNVEAHHSSGVDDFVFEYSTDGTNWTTMLTVSKTDDDNAYQAYQLPDSTSGAVSVRVVDSDASRDGGLETIFIDDMFIRSEGAAGMPVVTIAATDATAAEQGADPGVFTVTRSGDTTGDLTVDYTIGGTAAGGVDYETLTGSIVIPGGSASATITVTPLDDGDDEGTETVVLTLVSGGGYVVGAAESDTIAIIDNDGAASDDYAIGETSVYGTVTGGLPDIGASDGSYEAIREETYNRGKRSRLEHQWEFDVTGGSSVTFYVEAHHNSSNEEFLFEYSLDGENWISMVTVTKTADDDTYQTHTLQSPVSGTVFVRVTDTNRSRNEATQDTLFIDDMFFRSE
ncbi:MAG: Calx-beta domain-containing protein, partial [Thermoguttaceae bacterium]